MEVLLSLEPDLVISDSNLVTSHIEQLETLGIKVVSIAPNTIDEVIESMVTLGGSLWVHQKQGRL